MDGAVKIRRASLEDGEALLEIYKPYVEKTAISFEYETPSLEEFQERIARTLKRYPYLVAEGDGNIWGYSYAGPFVGRAAYGWAAELTIYLSPDKRKMGIGRKLYEAMEQLLKAQNITNLYACIGWTEKEDSYLTNNSARFHEHLGFRLAGRFSKCGYKFGKWYDMIWMEKIIGTHPGLARPVIPFPELPEKALQKAGVLEQL